MENLLVKFASFRGTCISLSNASYCRIFRREYTEAAYNTKPKKKIHPYRNIHPWSSLKDFSAHLVKNMIYNKNGIVVLNKPYGIPGVPPNIKNADDKHKIMHPVANAAEYTLSDALPYISEQLKYANLTIVKKPERYMSGITILAADKKVEEAVKRSILTAVGRGILYRTFWIVTTMIPNELKGKKHLAMQLQLAKYNKDNNRKAVILTSWSKTQEKNQAVKVLNVEFKVLSNSTLNLSSLVEIKSSTQKWHAIRLFAATVLYSPVLGDNYYGSRIQKVADTWLPVDPFLPITDTVPVLSRDLLDLLKLTQSRQYLIPTHIHLKSMCLPSLFKKGEDFIIDAPLLPPFDWTCQQLMFKYLMKQQAQDTQQKAEMHVTQQKEEMHVTQQMEEAHVAQ